MDYKRCVLNQRSYHQNARRKSAEHFSKQDFRTAGNVVNKLGDKLSSNGINVDVTVNEIKALQLTSPKKPRKSVEVERDK